MGVACGPGYTPYAWQALRSLAGIRYYPTHLSEPGFMRFNGLQDLNNQDEKSRKSKNPINPGSDKIRNHYTAILNADKY